MLNLWMAIGLFLLLLSGVRLLLSKNVIRKIIGFSLLSHAANLLLVTSGVSGTHTRPQGNPAMAGFTSYENMSDPLPQAFVLTAIVIGFALTGFLVIYHLLLERETK